jgi:outer membrane protein
MRDIIVLFVFVVFVLLGGAATPGAEEIQVQGQTGKEVKKEVRVVSLEECIDIALQNNHTRPVSRFGIEIAEAQYKQAMSSYWPQIAAKASYSIMDQDPNFIFPASNVNTPPMSFAIPTPMGPIPINLPAQSITVPEQDIKLMDKKNLVASLNLTYPLYTGGLRSALVKQAKEGMQAAREEARRTHLQVVYDVKRMYYGVVLSQELLQISRDALARMEVTLELTENLYTKGSGRVKKTDFLRNKTVVEGLRSAVAQVEANEKLAKAALTNTMGLDWDTPIEVSEPQLPFVTYGADLKELVRNAYLFNPDWARIEAGMRAAEAKIDEAKSGHFPKVALFGNLTFIENSYDKGIVTPTNKDSWTIGLGLELPLFSGFRTTYEVKEAHARLERLKEEKILLREGIALQVKHLFITMMSTQDQKKASGDAAKAAEENRDLNERAYQEELVETKDVIEAQLVESFMKAQYQKALYDHIEAQAHLDLIVGREVSKLLYGER